MCCDPLVAAFLMEAAFLSSDALSSIIAHPFSLATALAIVVFPTPGGPESKTPLFLGIFPVDHVFSHCLIDLT